MAGSRTVAGDWCRFKARKMILVLMMGALGLLLQERTQVEGSGSTDDLRVISAAYDSGTAALAPDSLATAWGKRLATRTETAAAPSTELGGTTLTVKGVPAQLLYVSPEQVNFLMPPGLEAGAAEVLVTAEDGTVSRGEIRIAAVSPGLFSADASGRNAPAGTVRRYRDNRQIGEQNLFEAGNHRQPSLIEPGEVGDELYLVLYATGIRGEGDQTKIRVKIGGIEVPVQYAGSQGDYAGLDQVNVKLPAELIGRGELEMMISVEGGGLSNSLFINTSTPPVAPRRGIAAGSAVPRPNRQAVKEPLRLTTTNELARAGQSFTITGSGFAPVPEANKVTIGGSPAEVLKATERELVIMVPFGVASGALTVKNSSGEDRVAKLRIRTTLSGFALNTKNEAVKDLSIELYNTYPNPDVKPLRDLKTDSKGLYVFEIPAGDYYISFNYGKSTLLRYPGISYPKQAVLEGRDNHLGRTSLQEISKSVYVPGTGATLSLANSTQNLPPVNLEDQGIKFQFPRETRITFPNGGGNGELGLSRVKDSLTPVQVPPGQFSTEVAQLTSIGAKLEPGGKLILPNNDNYLPGENVDLFQLDQKSQDQNFGRFVKVGTANVSQDGKVVESSLNAIREGSIYFVSKSRKKTTLTGRVVMEGSQEPARKAQIIVRGQQGVTDDNGHFTIRDIQAGEEDVLSVEAVLMLPDGRIARAERGDIKNIVVEGITNINDPLILKTQAGNRSPIISFFPLTIRLNAAQKKSYEFICFDPDGPDGGVVEPKLTPGNYDWLKIRNIGEGRWELEITAPVQPSTYAMRLSANDGVSEAAVLNLLIQVNGKPTARSFTRPLETHQSTPVDFTLGGLDPDNDNLTYQIVSQPERGKLETLQGERYRYTPQDAWSGTVSISYKVNDGLIDSEVVEFTIIVKPNEAPTLKLPEAQEVAPGVELKFDVKAEDKNTGQTLTLAMTRPPGAGATFVSESGKFSWTPTGMQTGETSAEFVATDNGNPVESVKGQVQIRVLNRPPVLTVPGARTVAAGVELSFPVSATDPDPGQTLKITARAGSMPDGAVFTPSVSGGQFKWTPTTAQVRESNYVIYFDVDDDGKPIASSSQTVVIKVTAAAIANRPPVLVLPGAQTGRVGELLSFTVSASDPDAGQTVTITARSLPSGATFVPTAGSGQFRWTPTTEQVGSHTISFTVTDNGAPALSETKTVTITVLPPNRAPVLTVPGAQAARVGEQLSFAVSASDPDAGQTLTITAGSLPPGATFVSTGGSGQFRWTPTTGQVGSYTISFTVTDNGAPVLSSSASVAIRVTLVFTTLNFTTASVSENRVVTRYAGKSTQQYVEDLGEGIRLEMVTVPG
ncbi:MAG: tandem-95 repeat protein, partial [Acidobacteria bacterium]|nr:tandem-95 repeat protein [Acidobacteriota bacterium]